jgi:competence protein ComEC
MSQVRRNELITFTALAVLAVSACGARQTAPTSSFSELAREVDTEEYLDTSAVDIHRVFGPKDMHSLGELEQGRFRVHMIDVGTGLAILVQGHDFSLLYDGGSADDSKNHTLVSYLYSALGPSGGKGCRRPHDGFGPDHDNTTERKLDHVILSHPHSEHANMLAEVFGCYKVGNLWDVGRPNAVKAYRQLWKAAAAEDGIALHTVAAVPNNRVMKIGKSRIEVSSSTDWEQFEEGSVIQLGEGARATVLHADAGAKNDFNENSLVLRVDLGATSLLLTGDAEGGMRNSVLAPATDIEGHLLDNWKDAIDVDILQVGQHGSLAGNRREFLDAVSPSFALLSSGPTRYRGDPLPDPTVVASIERTGALVLRTDEHDAAGCVVYDVFGHDNRRPGGCDNYVIEIGPSGPRGR